jgi:hypothetical protein
MVSFIGDEIDFMNHNYKSCTEVNWESIYQQVSVRQQVQQSPQRTPLKSKENQNLKLTLNFYGNHLSSLMGLPSLSYITELNLSSNEFISCDLPELERLPSLQTLDLSGNQITSVQNFPRLPNLRSLSLAFNSISSLQSLEICVPFLEEFDLRANNLCRSPDLDPLTRLSQLRKLRLAENKVADKIHSIWNLFLKCESLLEVDLKQKVQYEPEYEDYIRNLQTPKLDSAKVKNRYYSSSNKIDPYERTPETHNYPLAPTTASPVLFPYDRPQLMTSRRSPSPTNRGRNQRSHLSSRKASPTTNNKMNPWERNNFPNKYYQEDVETNPYGNDSFQNYGDDGFEQQQQMEEYKEKDGFFLQEAEENQITLTQSPAEDAAGKTHTLLERLFHHLGRLHNYNSDIMKTKFFYHWKMKLIESRSQQELMVLQKVLQEKDSSIHNLEEKNMIIISELQKKLLMEKNKISNLTNKIVQQETRLREQEKEMDTKEYELEQEKINSIINKEKEIIDSLHKEMEKMKEVEEMKRREFELKDKDLQDTKNVVQEKDKIILKYEMLLKNSLPMSSLPAATTYYVYIGMNNNNYSVDETKKETVPVPQTPQQLSQPPSPSSFDEFYLLTLQSQIKELQSQMLSRQDEFLLKENSLLAKIKTLENEKVQLELNQKESQLKQSSFEEKQKESLDVITKLENRLLTLQKAFNELSEKYQIVSVENLQLNEKNVKNLKTIKELSKCVKKLQEITEFRNKQQQDQQQQQEIIPKVCESCALLKEKNRSLEEFFETLKEEKLHLIKENQIKMNDMETKHSNKLLKQLELLESFQKEIEKHKNILGEKQVYVNKLEKENSRLKSEIFTLTSSLKEGENENALLKQQLDLKEKTIEKRKIVENRIKELMHSYVYSQQQNSQEKKEEQPLPRIDDDKDFFHLLKSIDGIAYNDGILGFPSPGRSSSPPALPSQTVLSSPINRKIPNNGKNGQDYE